MQLENVNEQISCRDSVADKHEVNDADPFIAAGANGHGILRFGTRPTGSVAS